MPSLSVCMIVQNSARTVAIALESLGNVYDELIVVDGGSTDSTCKIALSYGARIIHSEWIGNHSQQRNVYLNSVKTDWVFVIDSDEFIDIKTLEFLKFIKAQGDAFNTDNFGISRKWITPFSEKHYIKSIPHYPDFQTRLFKYNKHLFYGGHVHGILHGLTQQNKGLVALSIYHLDLFVNSEKKRRDKVILYSKNNPQDGGADYYLPEAKDIHIESINYQDILSSVQVLLDGIMNNSTSSSELNRIIPPEIKNDDFYTAIQKIAREENIKTVLEIGSSSGEGSTEAFVTGLRENSNKPTLFCMEVSTTRFNELQKRYANDSFVKCYNVSSVSVEQFPEENEIITFYNTTQTNLNYYSLERILSWLRQDTEYIKNSQVPDNGINKIKQENNISFFDVVLIDGSEFTGNAEFKELYGAKFILLDDINTFKNFENHQKLLVDENYTLLAHNGSLRNGYSIFKKVESIEKYFFEYEKSEQLLVNRLVRPGMLVFDVGANIGNYTILLSQLVGDSAQVYSFEPASSTFKKLQERIAESGRKNIRAFQMAVFSENTTITFNEFPDDYSAWNSIGKPKMLYPYGQHGEYVPIVNTETVEAITIDSFCQQHDIQKIDYLKLDVEGAESDALQGAIDLLRRKAIHFIQFEISQKMLEGLEREAKHTFDILIEHEYECHRITKSGEVGEEVVNSESFYENYIAFPSIAIHFFTIVLNGEPFIRYHIEVFKQLPFKWHWHIVEGVAELKHDTAWSLQWGGSITDEIHHKGRSKDGTTEYLDELLRLYPENVTVYRKPDGVFWDGKREMVNEPLTNIHEECLLWQVDADELWTVEQICTARQMFVKAPEKTAAFYRCWYFVGSNLVISTHDCYAHPKQEWLRTWRFKPGAVWAAHEPPTLVKPLPNGNWVNVAAINPFVYEETENLGLNFQHFAYVTQEQLQFKERYYGYANAVAGWRELQAQTKFPVLLRQYFSWVRDGALVESANSCGVVPIAQKEASSDNWRFLQPEELQTQAVKLEETFPNIIVDGIFFQFYQTGIARVWKSLLQEWVENGFAKYILVLDRAGTAPAIAGIKYRYVSPYDYGKTDADREMLQQVCDEEGADLFISTYYTTPVSTPSVFVAHDMIPEIMDWDLNHPMWREKHHGIRHAVAYIAVSENTARDLVRIFPNIPLESVIVAHNGINCEVFSPASIEEINQFKTKYGILKPYFILVGPGSGYKNSILFFQAFSQLCSRGGFDIVCTGSGSLLEAEFRAYTSGSVVHMLQLTDDEFRAAYSGAIALVYPSKYEGFGLPVLEAIACGCPVITCPNASIPEVAGKAALYVKDDDVDGLANALCDIQQPSLRKSLITAGLEQAKKFSWSKMAKVVSSVLIDTTLLPLKLRNINLIIFPDWSAPEESLNRELEQVIKAIATHPNLSEMTLLVDTSNISDEDANLILSGVTMNLLMQGDVEITEELEISLTGFITKIQWESLLRRINTRIVLRSENKDAIAREGVSNIPYSEIDSFSPKQSTQN